jgi:hypothetical protein
MINNEYYEGEELENCYDYEPDYESNSYYPVQIVCIKKNKEGCECKFCKKDKKEKFIQSDECQKYDDLMKQYEKYCKERKLPNFLFYRGFCPNCQKNNLDNWNHNEYITGCKYCCKTFCN